MAVSAPMGFAADNDAVKKLQEENAALRKRLAALEGSTAPAASTTTTTTTTAAAPTSAATPRAATMQGDEGVQTLSAFEVKTEKDYGYLKTNSVTATRIGVEIQRTPLAIEVKSAEFLADTNTNTITDILRYTSSGSGDNAFRMARPANGATPQGNFTLRGFQVNTLLRNGVTRYGSWNVDNAERVEIVKGPAALFFGSGSPGGVINYVTKQPSFSKIPTTVTYNTGTDHKTKVVLDTNQAFGKRAAMRIVGGWENSGGDRRFEFDKNNNLTASLAFNPFDSGKLKVTFEAEFVDNKFNENRQDWYFPSGWFQAYANPSQALINAAGVGVSGAADPVAAYRARIFNNGGDATWGNDLRTASGDLTQATYTKIIKGAYYTNRSGARIHDKAFNYTERGAYTKNDIALTSATVESAPFDWLDARYVITKDNSRFDSIEGVQSPYADGRLFNHQISASSGYYRKLTDQQFDLVFKKDMLGIKNKILVGGFFRNQIQQYNANANAGTAFPYYASIPGASNPAGNPGGTYNNPNPLAASLYIGGTFAPNVQISNNVPVNQVIKDRFGVIKTVQQVFTQWDPGFETQPDISPLAVINRAVLDGYKTQDQAGYLNYQGQMLDDRLTVIGGVRREMHRDSGQYATTNFPYFAPPPYAFTDQVAYPPSVYGYSPSYAGDRDGNFSRIAGTSWMGGLSYAIKKDINIYTSVSKIYNRNGATNAGGFSVLDVPDWYTAAKANLGATPFVYNGKTINSVTDLFSALHDVGADVLIKPETGQNVELGVKTALWDNQLVGTFSLFHMYRVNRRVDDPTRVANEPLNGVNNYQYFGQPGTVNSSGFNFTGGRLLRWRTVGQKDVIEGADAEVTWTPRRNFQTVINGAWMWTAETVNAPTVNKPGSAAYNAASAVSKIASDIYYGARLENVPEFRLNSFSKYTFTEGLVRGLSVAVGTRYSSKMVLSRSVAWNPLTNGFQSGNYLVFDSSISYPWEVGGYKLTTSFNVQNITDKTYFEGGTAASPGRQVFLSNTLKF
ncbi:MAG: TonB-dependent receptor plug domain-containing protein [Undibacterium sp.]|nr:TonB-dependent receptor plug domain-containing protein [Opitutaceae bacterium]